MKIPAKLAILATLLGAMLVGELSAQQATAFTYQGQLADAGSPATGLYDLHFEVFNAPEKGDSLGEIATSATTVANGLFTVLLDFGPGVFDGGPRWLEIGARANGEDGYDILSPRQQVAPVPFAAKAGGVDASGITGTLSPAAIGPGSITTTMLTDGSVGPAQLAGSVGIWSRIGNDIHYLDGKVGIGTSSPVQELEIAMSGGEESALTQTVPHVFQDPVKRAGAPGGSVVSGGSVPWLDPKAALKSDNIYTSLDITSDLVTSSTLTLSDFGFSIPEDATITGFEVVCEAIIDDSSDLTQGRLNARLTTSGSVRSYSGDHLAEGDIILGSSADLWGWTPTPAKVNEPTFGVRIEGKSGSVVFGSGRYRAWLDQVQVVVYYTTPRDGQLSYTMGCRPGAANLEFAPGTDLASPVMTLTRDARVGIGTGEPVQELEIRMTGGDESGLTFSLPHTFHDLSSLGRPPAAAAGSGGGVGWATPGNVLASDNSYATVDIHGDHVSSNTLTVNNFGLTVPGDATITGFEVVCEASINDDSDAGFPGTMNVRLTTSGAIRSRTGGQGESDIVLGTPSDLWGWTPTPAAVNAATFGVRVQCESGGSTFSTADYAIWLDQVRVIVYYTTPRDGSLSYTIGSSVSAGDLRLSPGGNVASPAMTLTQEGDVGIGTTAPTETLHVVGNILATGTITPSSDRNLKKNFAAVDPGEILEQLAALPIQQWAYRAEADTVSHVGPMAQDFHSAFHLGANDTTIATVDADGVALAAIQGLNRKLEEKETEIAGLQERILRLERLMDTIRKEAAQ
ncbi:MAG: tail fiber domain-containing protein [Akkermansiaceae bacterium]|nr:tail fiber domain-containing protein [Akkermansiaceae bacterium]